MIPGSANPLLLATAAAGGYSISRSVRFNSSDSAYLSRTPASAGNRKTWTWAGWVKRSGLGVNSGLFETSGSPRDDANSLSLFFADGNFGTGKDALTIARHSFYNLITTQVFRDPAAWYHIVLVADTVQATASNRLKLYVNGSQITSFTSATYPSLNEDLPINASVSHSIGRHAASAYLNGYLADIHFIDGQALDPTSFGEFSATTGVWMPKAYSGSYGTNGFHLDFADNSTAAALGTDSSGQGNTWTVNNLSVTAGAGNDSLVDVPTNGSEVDTGNGGEVRGNYATLNPLDKNQFGAGLGPLANGNLELVGAAGIQYTATSTIAIRGSCYAEIVGSSYVGLRGANNGIQCVWSGSQYYNGSSFENVGVSYSITDVVGIAFNSDTLALSFYKNGSLQFTRTTGAGEYVYHLSINNAVTGVCNFGQRQFAYTSPAGFKALCTANLPAPTIVNPSTAMDVKLYTGNGSTQTISGLGFSPDFVWLKGRSVPYPHGLHDTVRGVNRFLISSTTDAEIVNEQDGFISAFTSDGFTISPGSRSSATFNQNSATYAGWCWDAGSSTVTNTAGSITSNCRTNASAGFSIVSYTGSGAQATVGHGLGVSPGFIVAKSRTATGGYGWAVYHSSLGKDAFLNLNATSASTSFSNYWGTATPNSTVFGVGNGSFDNNTGEMIAYCFAPVAGYSSAFSYSGNGSSDGPMVWLGFRPRLVLIKCSSASGINWVMMDTARNTYNVVNGRLFPNASDQEYTNVDAMDILSNGFKLRTVDGTWNTSGATYIGFAFAESPFQYARAR